MTLEERLSELAQGLGRRFAEERDRLRAERLELSEALFDARKRFDQLAEDFEDRLALVKDGEPGPPGESVKGDPGAPGRDGITGEARGKYDPAESYAKLDRVSFNGSEWIARQDDPGPLPGPGWMLGAQGKRGKPGIGIQDVKVDGYVLALELSNGRTIDLDLRGMFERYDQERAG